MPEVVTSFRLETTEFDSKLRNATQFMKNMAESAWIAGKDFKGFDESVMKTARSFGSFDTGAKNAADSLKLLVKEFNDLAGLYNVLPKNIKENDFGQSLAAGLKEMKSRIAETKKELYDAGDAMNKMGSDSSQLSAFLEALAGKFGINVAALTKFGGALAVVSAAVKIGTDAFKLSASNMDEWDKAVAGAKAGYETFLFALNSGDFSGFFSRISAAIQKAKEAAEAINNLEVNSGVRNTERLRLQARQQQLREIIKTQGAGSAAGQQAQRDLEALNPQLRASYRREAGENRLVLEGLIDTKLRNSGLAGQISVKDVARLLYNEDAYNRFKAGATGAENVNKRVGTAGYANTVDTRNLNQRVLDAVFTKEFLKTAQPYVNASFSALSSSYNVGLSNNAYLKQPKATGGTLSGANLKTERELVGLIEIQEQKISDLRTAMRQATTEQDIANYREEIKKATEELDRLNGKIKEAPKPEYATGLSGVSQNSLSWWQNLQQGRLAGLQFGTAEYAAVAENIINTQLLSNLINEAIKYGVTIDPETTEELFDKILGGGAVPEEAFENLKNAINEELKKMGLSPIEINGNGTVSTEKDVEKEGQKVSISGTLNTLAGGLNSITGGLEKLGVEIPEGLKKTIGAIEGVASILTGIGTLVSLISMFVGTKAVPIIGWALARGGVVHAANGYVPGNYMSGDMVPAMLNSGELVLNRAQVGNLASQLSGNSVMNNLNLTATISGEQIRLALNNNSRRRGRGEFVTSKTLR